MIPAKDEMTIGFAHAAYRFMERFELRNTGIKCFEVRTREDIDRRMGEADVLVISGLWHNGLIDLAGKLRFIQAISSGTDFFDLKRLQAKGVRLANAQGVAARAVSEHAMALIMALIRRLPEARDNQVKHFWRGMMGDLSRREDELSGKTLLIVGLGMIGDRLAHLGKAFDMNVIGVRRDPAQGKGHADEIHALSALGSLLPRADFVALTCPLTPATEKLINAETLGLMKPSAYLINVARGRCADEPALIDALRTGRIAGAGIDVAVEEPLAADSPLWDLRTALITPHTGGDTHRYEDSVLDMLQDNLGRLWRNETKLYNEII